MRVGTLAITDHDTTDAIPAARAEIARSGLALNLVPGSRSRPSGKTMKFIFGLNIDIEHPALVTFLQEQKTRRNQREMIGERLEKAHIPGALEGAKAANGGAVTRGHFARFLVEAKQRPWRMSLKSIWRGKTGYVPPQWCTIKQAIDVIHHSGGKAVLAHPGRYNLSAKWLKRLLAHFAECGGEAMEVAQCQQAPNERAQLATYARQFGLLGRRALISISPARGSNWGASSGCPQALSRSGSSGNSRSKLKRGKYESVFLYPSG
jgi:predicted metal-dependent phosphoesterase TrpH